MNNYTQTVFKIMKEIIKVITRMSINASNYNVFTPFVLNFNPHTFTFKGVYIKICSLNCVKVFVCINGSFVDLEAV